MGRDHEAELRSETRKWAERLDAALKDARAMRPAGNRFLDNIRAYQRDARHFEAQDDLVRAFECVVWAWAWLEIGAQQGLVEAPALRGTF